MEAHLVQLDRDHPGFRDLAYRGRRDAIAHLADNHRLGEPPPFVEYTAEEHGVWRTALDALAPLHARYASPCFHEGWKAVALPPNRVPQLNEVGARLEAISGFRYQPVAGLVTPRFFLERLADRWFLSTQYMRHHSMPLYTPEPDVIHELVGHAALLATPAHAEINALFGRATRASDDAIVEGLIRLYWYGLEFGLSRDGGQLRAVGAGLLSSFGELGRFETHAQLRPFDVAEIQRTPFDPTAYQGTLFVADTEAALLTALRRVLEPLCR
ncbi:MAG: phenylalanine 4-monooxygenase [Archangiaceae bacterium]|nr:phenylalanine 4-monooxygenase [Archangiaceae bacterium]